MTNREGRGAEVGRVSGKLSVNKTVYLQTLDAGQPVSYGFTWILIIGVS